MEIDKKDYGKYVKSITPAHNIWKNMIRAFGVGGMICTIGQIFMNGFAAMDMERDAASSWTTLLLIVISTLLTGLNIYPKLVKFGGAGALVPITGFSNAVTAAAMEYKAEGQVFGIGCKIFTIAGPVILFGIVFSWTLGIVYWGLGKMI